MSILFLKRVSFEQQDSQKFVAVMQLTADILLSEINLQIPLLTPGVSAKSSAHIIIFFLVINNIDYFCFK
jgi:hypothetical protein